MQDSYTDRNVYILGAGFSADANAPLLYNFLDKSRELLDDPGSGLDANERSEFRTVFEFRRRMAQAREKVKMDLDNIEQLFGLVEMEQRLGLGDSDARSATVYLIAKTLELMIARGQPRQEILFSANPRVQGSIEMLRNLNLPLQTQYDPAKSSLGIYDFFAMLIGGRFDARDKRAHRKDVVITFNYDLVLDHALMRANIPISYHLPPQHVSMPAANNKEGLALLKLHGSTNWAVCGKCKQRISISFDKMTSSPGIFKSLECIECQKQAFQPMLVPPSWDKTEYQSLMRPVWNQAVSELQKATRICIIGYSLPESDAYFKYLLTLGLAENHGLYKFIVVDLASRPSPFSAEESQESPRLPKTLQQRYEELLEDVFQERRFAFHNEGLWQWVQGGTILQELGRGEMIIRG
jgi:NAD-dependent SIR2 family protein deacetylase